MYEDAILIAFLFLDTIATIVDIYLRLKKGV